jgi:hypothetical protein
MLMKPSDTYKFPVRWTGDIKKTSLDPLFFSLPMGLLNHKYTAWVFPDPSTQIKPDCLQRAAFDRICNRFKLVREDLEMALVSEVKVIISELRMPEYGDCDDRPEMWAVIVRMLERKAQL